MYVSVCKSGNDNHPLTIKRMVAKLAALGFVALCNPAQFKQGETVQHS